MSAGFVCQNSVTLAVTRTAFLEVDNTLIFAALWLQTASLATLPHNGAAKIFGAGLQLLFLGCGREQLS